MSSENLLSEELPNNKDLEFFANFANLTVSSDIYDQIQYHQCRKNLTGSETDFLHLGSVNGSLHEELFCGESFQSLGESYKKFHGYIALIVCFFGMFANIMNLIVLTRKEMATPINRMLTALAFADMLVMIEYIPFAFHMYILKERTPDEEFSYAWALFVLFHTHFTQILHTISIQLTLTMAIWRYVAISGSNRSSSYCTFRRCNMAIAAAYICPVILCVLNYLTFAIKMKQECVKAGGMVKIENNDPGHSLLCLDATDLPKHCGPTKELYKKINTYLIRPSDLAMKNNELLNRIHFWTFSVVIKLIPCLVLTFFMCWLVNTLYKAKRRHKMLEQGSAPLTKIDGKSNGDVDYDETSHRERQGSGKQVRIASEAKTEAASGLLVPVIADEVSGEGRRDSKDETGKERRKSFVRIPSLRRNSCGKGGGKRKRTDRTSKMLIAVLVLFLVTEFPQGIMAFLSGFYGHHFFRYCYNTWAEVWDILALLNSAINFILYCFMSKQFRTQFRQIFRLESCFRRKSKWIDIATCNLNATISTTV